MKFEHPAKIKTMQGMKSAKFYAWKAYQYL